MLRISPFVLALACAGLALAQVATSRVDSIVEAARTKRDIPGVSVAIITPQGTLLKGYGVRNLETREPVTEHTAFDVGSVTKSFTALGAAILVDSGKLDWDRPVKEYIPWFQMYDPVATQLMTARDLLTHRSGLARYDTLRFAVPLTREELVRRLRYLPPTATFRSKYQYQNLMYTAAGFLTGTLDGSSWEELTEKRIFGPIGMKESTVRITDLIKTADYASPHERDGGSMKRVEFYDYQKFGVGPNGAVNSSASDLARYLRFYLNDGVVDGKQIVSKRQMVELQRPQMVVDDSSSYGLGWNVDWSPGFKLVSHSGAITGFSAFAAFAPEKGEGIVVLTNTSGAAVPVGLELMRDVLGWKPVATRPALPPEPKPVTAAPSGPLRHPLAEYAGRYSNPGFGPCDLEVNGEQLTVVFPAMRINLKHKGAEVFEGAFGIKGEFTPDGILLLQTDAPAPALEFRRATRP